MKVLLVSNGYPPHRWAGTETYTAGIAKGLLARGYAVQVLCAGEWETGEHYWNGVADEVYQGVPVRRLHLNWSKAPDPARYLYDNPVLADYMANYLKEVQPDLVHVTSCETLSASVLRVVKQAQLPLVLSLTDFWFLCPRINLLRSDGANCNGQTKPLECLRCQLNDAKAYQWPSRILPETLVSNVLLAASHYPLLTKQRGLRGMAANMGERKAFLHQALGWPDKLLTASAFTRNVHTATGVAEPIALQPYGHDLSWLQSYQGKSASDVVRIGFIGQIIHSKGVHLLLQAAKQLHARLGDRFQLVIYGNVDKVPEYGAELRALAAALPNVTFCGTYAHEQSAAVFSGFDVLVVPSLWYDFPLIIYEAFATKTPVVATNLGGMAEAVTHETSGLLFERNNVTDLAAQLERIVVEPGLLERLRLGVPGVKTLEQSLSEIEAIYIDLLTKQNLTTPAVHNSICQ